MTFPVLDFTQGFVVSHLDHTGTVIDQFKPENLRFTLNRKSPHTITYEVSHEYLQYLYGNANFDMTSGLQDFVGAYRTDFELRYNGYYIMGGMHVPAPVVTKGDAFTTINGKSYLHYLERRHYPYDPGTLAGPATGVYAGLPHGERVNFKQAGSAGGDAYTAYYPTDVTVAITAILDVTINGVTGFPITDSLPIIYPSLVTPIGVDCSMSVSLGDLTPILSFIDALSNIGTGFDYEVVDEFKEFRIYAPRKYDPLAVTTMGVASYVFDSTNADLIIAGPSFTNNGPLATHWVGMGNGVGSAQIGYALDMPAVGAVYRRLDGGANYDLRNEAVLLNMAMKDMAFAANPAHEIEMTVDGTQVDIATGGAFFNLFSPGFAVWVDSELHSHRIQSGQEIVSMDVQVEDSGAFTCRFGFNQIYNPQTAGTYTGT